MNVTTRYQIALLATFLIGSSAFGAVAERGRLQAGAARVDITPPVNPAYPPSGKYEHEHLYIRAIVLDNGLTRAALLNADLGNMPEDVWTNASKQIAEELKCPVENIIMSATHTHSGVAAGPPPPGLPSSVPWGSMRRGTKSTCRTATVGVFESTAGLIMPGPATLPPSRGA
jgi:hypothetical protein